MNEQLKPLRAPEDQPIAAELKEKILAAWGSARDQLKAPNAYRLAEILYKSLYRPDSFAEGEIRDREEFAREKTLRSPLGKNRLPATVPDEKKFIEAVRHALTSETNFDKALFPESLETVRRLAEYGPICIWSAGDMNGSIDPNEAEKQYPGSREQIKRVAKSGLADLRRSLSKETGSPRHEILTMTAAENKIELLPQILEEAQKRKLQRLIVVDDRVSNILQAIDAAKEAGIEIFPIWVRQGLAKDNIPTETEGLEVWKQKLNAIDSIADLSEKLLETKALNSDSVGFLIDYDDVLSSDARRMDLQVQSVGAMLRRNNWIQ